MKILVGCEFSGRIREAFRMKGHDSWSCDLLESEIEGKHIVGDILEVGKSGWDMIIAHPPCRYLTNARARWNSDEDEVDIIRSIEFWMDVWRLPVERMCIENPVGKINNLIKPNQITCYSRFGTDFRKRTCFWLRGLPPLIERLTGNSQAIPFQNYKRDWRSRVLTPVEIAEAMANQWG